MGVQHVLTSVPTRSWESCYTMPRHHPSVLSVDGRRDARAMPGVHVRCSLTTINSAAASSGGKSEENWQSRCQSAAKPIAAFLEGTVVYVLS